MSRTVAIVPHTHWDREWYSSFQTFRLRLVALLDQFLPLLERDPSYARFLLDGQTAVLDDYLEVRPEAEPLLRRLAATGRLSVGPWMILMDEFMVSGETMVRDLQMGMARASEFGGAMPVGYLPDMFGHVAQMPQLLVRAGFEHAVVWRGVPEAVDVNAFWWIAPDGSRVRAEYLYGSSSNGRDVPDDAKQLVARARDYETELGDARLGDLLFMNGTDHQTPQPWLGRVVAEANALQDDYHFVVTSLGEYLPTQPVVGLASWAGELRSGARANLLMGVASNRVDIHQAAAAAERALEKRAEPVHALFGAPGSYPSALLDVAWRLLVLNSAHDSSCACSHDEVVDQVAVRYAEARQIGDGLTRAAMTGIAAEVDAEPGSTLVVNPTQAARRGLVHIPVQGEGPVHIAGPGGRQILAQVIGTRSGEAFGTMVTANKVRWVLDLMRGGEFAGRRARSASVREVEAGSYLVLVEAAGPTDPATDLEPVRDQLVALADQEPDAVIRFRLTRTPTRDVVFMTPLLPGFGWSVFRAVDGDAPPEIDVVSAGDTWIASAQLRVEIDPHGGTFAIASSDGLSVAGLGRYVEGGDGGDTYNYSPPARDAVIDTPDDVRVEIVERGPVRAIARVRQTYTWPRAGVGDDWSLVRRSDETETVEITTDIEVRAGEPFVRVHGAFDNRCRDHRLRAHFPLPAPVDGSDAECAFSVVHRGLTAEGGPSEVGLPTFPCRRFVDCSDGQVGLALIHDGLLEYEVVEDGRELALTLLRATGWLSRIEPSLRPNPAGPPDPVRGAQMLRECTFSYAVLPHRGTWRDAGLYDVADGVLVPFERVAAGGGTRTRPATGSALTVDGAVVSAVLREAGALTVRMFRASDDAGAVGISLGGVPARGWLVDLRGRPVEPFEGTMEIGAWEIATVRITSEG
jgi:alpha-mannosidase